MAINYGGLQVNRLGHSSLRIVAENSGIIYIDSWSNVLEGEPGDADIVLISHDDPDHYDIDAIKAVSNANTTIAAYEEVDTSELDRDVIKIPYDGEITVEDIEIQATPAHNRGDGDHVDDEGEPFHDVREVIGLNLKIDGTSVYYTSDTDFLDEHRDIDAEVLILPIGGHYTMDRHEAADFAEAVDPTLVLPVHYNTFEAIETDEDAFVEDVERRGDIRVELF